MLLLIQLGSHNVANLVFDRSGCSLLLSVTTSAGKVMRSVVSIFFCFVFWVSWLCVYGSRTSSPVIERQGLAYRSRSKFSTVNVFATWLPTVESCEYWSVATAVGFHFDVISCDLSQRGMQSGAAEASSCSRVQQRCGLGSAVGLTLIFNWG